MDVLQIAIQTLLDVQKEQASLKKQIKKIALDPIEVNLKVNGNSLQSQVNNVTKATKSFNAELERTIAANKLQIFFDKNSKAANKFGSEFDSLKAKAKTIFDSNSLREWNRDFAGLSTTIKATGTAGAKAFESLTKNALKFGSWIVISGAVMFGINALRRMVQSVISIDTAMTSLRKTTDLTDSQYNDFLVRASNNARELGSSISDLVEASAEFSRTGFSVPESEELAKVATTYKNVADGMIDIGQASTVVISTLKAFNLTAEKSWQVIDILNEVGKQYCPAA